MPREKLWYKNAIFYQLHVKCFHDSNEDGIGDFQGLTKKLDYIQSLGCTTIWLQPFYPSPLRDDGYDIADYTNIHPHYGTLNDFRKFLNEAHRRNIKVVTELVINHTSDQHAWFQRARRAKPGSDWHEFYMWSDTPDKYSDARIIFKDFETSNWAWDPVAKRYYWHRFYSHQPDLNYDSPKVHEEIFKVLDFWMKMGVDGMRLDAIPYLFAREGTNCENLPETHAFLKKLRKHIDSRFDNRMLLAEANQWPEDAVNYFGQEDECHMAYHFPVMPRLFMSLKMEDRFPIFDIMEQTPQPPATCQWAIFLRNHDELTLEMVTDEERDYMWRVYAKDPKARINLGIRRRLAPLLENDRLKIELMNILLFSLPGTPIVYYGDELGMGDNYYLGDRDGVRTPMQWSNDRNAGFSDVNPQKLYLPLIIDPQYHHDHLNVENEEQNPSSLLRWMQNAISVRQQCLAFGHGNITFLTPSNSKIIVFLREYEDETILVAANLSRYAQQVELNLEGYQGYTPIDLFSQNQFVRITDDPYRITLGRYGYYWLKLEKLGVAKGTMEPEKLPNRTYKSKWEEILEKNNRQDLLNILAPYMKRCRWYRAKAKKMRSMQIVEHMKMGKSHLLFLEADYGEEGTQTYMLPLTYVSMETGTNLSHQSPNALIAELAVGNQSGYLIDAIYEDSFRHDVLKLLIKHKTLKGLKGELTGSAVHGLKKFVDLPSHVLSAEQSNTSMLFGDALYLKIYRSLEDGLNPDVEIVKALTESKKFTNIPPYKGEISYRNHQSSGTFALLQEFIPNTGDLWKHSLDVIRRYYDEILSKSQDEALLEKISNVDAKDPNGIFQFISPWYWETIALLGKRTAEMHVGLATCSETPDMKPEKFSQLYQRSLYQGMRSQLRKNFSILKNLVGDFDEKRKTLAYDVLDKEKEISSIFDNLLKQKLDAVKIRIHGDFHLGQVLFTGNDLILFDFEGEPALPLSQRRLKRSVFQDIAGIIRSFQYACYAVLQSPAIGESNKERLRPYAAVCYRLLSQQFLQTYFNQIQSTMPSLIPENKEHILLLLKIYLMNKAIYELGYELQNRPDWIQIPLEGIHYLLGEQE